MAALMVGACPLLATLDVGFNPGMGEAGGLAVALAVASSTRHLQRSLTDLNVAGCGIDAGAAAYGRLARSVALLPNLVALSVGNCTGRPSKAMLQWLHGLGGSSAERYGSIPALTPGGSSGGCHEAHRRNDSSTIRGSAATSADTGKLHATSTNTTEVNAAAAVAATALTLPKSVNGRAVSLLKLSLCGTAYGDARASASSRAAIEKGCLAGCLDLDLSNHGHLGGGQKGCSRRPSESRCSDSKG
jgi:hypothetical protein